MFPESYLLRLDPLHRVRLIVTTKNQLTTEQTSLIGLFIIESRDFDALYSLGV